MKQFGCVLLLAAPLLFGCGEPPVDSGYVVARSYDDPDDWTTREDVYRYTCEYGLDWDYTTGEYRFGNHCKNRRVGSETVHHHDDAHWYLKIRDDKDKKRIVRIEVTESDQLEHPVGSHWPDLR
jgi:hypothetical protein